MKRGQSLENRIHFIDEIRGFAVLCMIIYHGFYLFGTFFENEAAMKLFEFFMPVQPLFAGVFSSAECPAHFRKIIQKED